MILSINDKLAIIKSILIQKRVGILQIANKLKTLLTKSPALGDDDNTTTNDVIILGAVHILRYHFLVCF